MKLTHLVPALALACVVLSMAQVYAVVSESSSTANHDKELDSLKSTMEQIAENLGDETSVEDLDATLEDIDTMLDEGSINEDDLLDIRDAAVALRIEANSKSTVPVENTLVGIYSGGSYYSGGGGGYCSSCNTCSTCSSGGGGGIFSGGGGGGLLGGSGIRRFWPLLGLVALAAIDGDDDGDTASIP